MLLCAFFVLMGGSLHFGEAAAAAETDGPTRPPSMSAGNETDESAAPSESAQPTPTPEPEVFNISFIGDITPDAVPYYRNSSVAYQNVVTAENLGYVFEKTIQYFEDDDFTMANFECVLSNYDVPADKNFTFRAPPEYVGILTSGSVEFVTLGNNHVEDYGEQGYADTKATLDDAGIGYAGRDEYTIYETESGLKIGVYAVSFGKVSQIQAGIAALKEAGAEFIIAALHWGDEGSYDVNSLQLEQGHAAIDAGADVVYGSHPHVLQRIDEYNGGWIVNSLGNWSFGGNTAPRDRDTAIVQFTIKRDVDGKVSVEGYEAIPCCLSSTAGINDYRPVPYEEGSADYERAMSKLDGSFDGPDLSIDYSEFHKDEENAAGTESSGAAEAPADAGGGTE